MADPDTKLSTYQSAVARTFPPKVHEALRMIGHPPLQLLALRRYVRKAGHLDAQWAWSHQQIRGYETGPQGARVRAEIEKVKRKFEELNPGYTLGVSPPRDLARQVRFWNGNHTVHAAAASIRAKCLQELGMAGYPEMPGAGDIERFRAFLGRCEVHPEPTSAAPGLSDHGQMHAVDFIIMQGHRKIADTISARILIDWVMPGWDRKLKAAVKDSGSLFGGPLPHPPEPWHYWLPH